MNLQLGAAVTIVWLIALVVWARRELGDRNPGTEASAAGV
jgi:hypothetical protein